MLGDPRTVWTRMSRSENAHCRQQQTAKCYLLLRLKYAYLAPSVKYYRSQSIRWIVCCDFAMLGGPSSPVYELKREGRQQQTAKCYLLLRLVRSCKGHVLFIFANCARLVLRCELYEAYTRVVPWIGKQHWRTCFVLGKAENCGCLLHF